MLQGRANQLRTGRQFHVDRAPLWCVRADHPRASRSAAGSPASTPSGHLRQSPPHDLVAIRLLAIRYAFSSLPFPLAWPAVLREVPGLEASPLCAICMKWRGAPSPDGRLQGPLPSSVQSPISGQASRKIRYAAIPISAHEKKKPRTSGAWHGILMSSETKGAGRRLAAVRGGHYVPAPAGRPHGPRRCGGPEHHGVFPGSSRLSTLVPASSCQAHLRKSFWKSTVS